MATEKRLIIDALKKYHDAQFTPGVYEHSIFGKAAMLLEVDAVEVVHGKYEVSEGKDEWYAVYYICQECNAQFMVSNEEGMIIPPNYCPNCGAKMDGDGNGRI